MLITILKFPKGNKAICCQLRCLQKRIGDICSASLGITILWLKAIKDIICHYSVICDLVHGRGSCACIALWWDVNTSGFPIRNFEGAFVNAALNCSVPVYEWLNVISMRGAKWSMSMKTQSSTVRPTRSGRIQTYMNQSRAFLTQSVWRRTVLRWTLRSLT